MKKWILFLAIIVSSCGSKEEPRKVEKPHELGKYLYLTDNNVLHCQQKCHRLRYANDEEGHKVQGMDFILTDRFVDNGNITYCTWCFDDDMYEKVQVISNQNRVHNTRPWARDNDEDNVPPSRRKKNDSAIVVDQP